MTVKIIALEHLLLAFLPALAVFYLMFRWQLDYKKAVYAMFRMLLQLLLIGYALVMLFTSESGFFTLAVLFVMLFASAWISLNTISADKSGLFLASSISIFLGGGSMLALVSFGVLQIEPWFNPQYMIPLAGMIFANAMTSISLAGERLQAELARGQSFRVARATGFKTALVPIINSMFAVGLVSLPGMMTGQILAGVEPVIAARYQIMVMCMLFSASGISTAVFLILVERKALLRVMPAS